MGPTILLYATLGVCALCIAWVVVRYDLYEREPWFMVLAAIGLGALGMWLAYHGQLALILATNRAGWLVSDPLLALFAGTTEEIAKLAAVGAIALLSRRHFNEPLDGLVYGSFAGLGAAIEESVAVLSNIPDLALLPAQEPVRLAGHLVMGGIGGFGMGLITCDARRATAGIAASLATAIALHTAWDIAAFAAASQPDTPSLRAWHTPVAMLLMLGGMVIYRYLVALGARWSHEVMGCSAPGSSPSPP